eukprot:scaffold221859_cov29-Tisochrysis_lutea.AAC.3
MDEINRAGLRPNLSATQPETRAPTIAAALRAAAKLPPSRRASSEAKKAHVRTIRDAPAKETVLLPPRKREIIGRVAPGGAGVVRSAGASNGAGREQR